MRASRAGRSRVAVSLSALGAGVDAARRNEGSGARNLLSPDAVRSNESTRALRVSATKWLPKWLGCEPRLTAVSKPTLFGGSPRLTRFGGDRSKNGRRLLACEGAGPSDAVRPSGSSPSWRGGGMPSDAVREIGPAPSPRFNNSVVNERGSQRMRIRPEEDCWLRRSR